MMRLHLAPQLLLLGAALCSGPGQGPDALRFTTELETRPGFYYYSPNSFSVAEDKANLRLVKEPGYQSARPSYQKLVVGNHEKKKNIAVVIDEAEGKPPRIYIDANNNGDLTDDGSPLWANESEAVYQKDVTVKATFMAGGKAREVDLPYKIMRAKGEERRRSNGGDVVIYSARFGRSGTLRLRGKEYLVSVKTTNQGLYPRPDKQIILIDRNRDGKLDRSALSAELFVGAGPFNIDGESYRVAGASELGDEISLEVSPVKVDPKRYIVAGEPSPDFSFTTLAGKRLRLSDFRGKVVLLDFWATWCGPCVKSLPEIEKMYGQFDRSRFEVIGVSLDGGDTHSTRADLEQFLAKSPVGWPVAFDDRGNESAVARMFNISGIPVEVLVDQHGVMRLVLVGGGEERMEQIRAAIAKLVGP